MSRRAALRLPALVLVALAVAAGLAALATGAMRSTKLPDGTCETTGGGRFVDIPGFPGEKIDRRLLSDIRYLRKRYKIFITDGYSTDPVHSASGEHPVGLALDIVPNTAEGGRWRDITRLAKWAEPSQNRPRFPFRWVGYDGDPNHGRGHHLHLSWSHSESRFGKPARTVYSIRCPGQTGQQKPPPEPEPTEPDDDEQQSGPTGGIKLKPGKLAPKAPESGGVSARDGYKPQNSGGASPS